MALWDSFIVYPPTKASYWAAQTTDADAQLLEADEADIGGSILSVVWTRGHPATVEEDVAVWSIKFAVKPGGPDIFGSLIASDAAAVETSFTNLWWTPMAGTLSDEWTLREFQWRNFGADYPISPKTGLSKPGPIWRVTPKGTAAVNTPGRLPDQLCSTVSYRTGSRRHWGRSYIGGLTTGALDVNTGRITTVFADLLAVSTKNWFANVGTLPRVIEPIVWSAKYLTVMSINQLVVDDVPDVIRRRRAKHPAYHRIYSS